MLFCQLFVDCQNFTKNWRGLKSDLSEVDPGVEAGLGLLVQGVLHRSRLELLLRPERLLLVKHLAELAQIHFKATA